jgi:hypothetical protein
MTFVHARNLGAFVFIYKGLLGLVGCNHACFLMSNTSTTYLFNHKHRLLAGTRLARHEWELSIVAAWKARQRPPRALSRMVCAITIMVSRTHSTPHVPLQLPHRRSSTRACSASLRIRICFANDPWRVSARVCAQDWRTAHLGKALVGE